MAACLNRWMRRIRNWLFEEDDYYWEAKHGYPRSIFRKPDPKIVVRSYY